MLPLERKTTDELPSSGSDWIEVLSMAECLKPKSASFTFPALSTNMFVGWKKKEVDNVWESTEKTEANVGEADV